MAKRFTDTEKYKNPFVRGLQGAYKLLWDYILADCDNAGIWVVDFEVAQIYLGKDMKVNRDDALRFFNEGQRRIYELEGGKKWFIPSFITFQYNELAENNRAHTKIIFALNQLGVLKEGKLDLSPLQGASDGAMVMVMGKDVVRVMETGMDTTKPLKKKKQTTAELAFDLIPNTFHGDEFAILWDDYEKLRAAKKKPLTETAVKQRIGQLVKISGGNWGIARASMEKTIAGAWDEFFEVRDTPKHQPAMSGAGYGTGYGKEMPRDKA